MIVIPWTVLHHIAVTYLQTHKKARLFNQMSFPLFCLFWTLDTTLRVFLPTWLTIVCCFPGDRILTIVIVYVVTLCHVTSTCTFRSNVVLIFLKNYTVWLAWLSEYIVPDVVISILKYCIHSKKNWQSSRYRWCYGRVYIGNLVYYTFRNVRLLFNFAIFAGDHITVKIDR